MAGYVIKSEYLNKSLGKLFVDHDTTTVGKKFLVKFSVKHLYHNGSQVKGVQYFLPSHRITNIGCFI